MAASRFPRSRERHDLVGHYRELLASNPLFAEGACWTVSHPGTDFRSLIDRLSLGEVEVGEPVSFDELYGEAAEADGEEHSIGCLIDSSAGASLLEVAGFAGASNETLTSLSKGDVQVASFVWIAANGSHHLAFARTGQVWGTGELDGDPVRDLRGAPAEAVQIVAELLTAPDEDPVAIGLAAVEAWSGHHLDSSVVRLPSPRVSFAPLPEAASPRMDTLFGRRDPALALAIDNASPEHRLAARTHAVAVMLAAKRLADHSACQRVGSRLAAGLLTDPRNLGDLSSLATELKRTYKVTRKGITPIGEWQRWQATQALSEFATQRTDRHEGWHRVFLALSGDQDDDAEWRELRTHLLDILTN